ncbi:MAG: hypothetical protein R3B70_36210 [Polyangiaceae bacterium]
MGAVVVETEDVGAGVAVEIGEEDGVAVRAPTWIGAVVGEPEPGRGVAGGEGDVGSVGVEGDGVPALAIAVHVGDEARWLFARPWLAERRASGWGRGTRCLWRGRRRLRR